MAAKSFTAAQVHDGFQWLPAGTTVCVNDAGFITQLLRKPLADTIHLEGVLCPGFVNAHCHLELSHLQGRVPERTGIVDFLIFVSTRRSEFDNLPKKVLLQQAWQQMKDNGIVAVGDIVNTTDTLPAREQQDILFHTFIEALGMVPERARQRLESCQELYSAFEKQDGPHRQSISPHAPYSVSTPLFQLIDEIGEQELLSIHNQEGRAEDQYFESGSGDMLRLFAALGLKDIGFVPSGKSSLETYGDWLHPSHPLLLVHNSVTQAAAVRYARQRFQNLWFCLCPNANLYIEGKLPDVPMLLQEGAQICIGTDSLASNHQLSVLAELSTLKKYFPELSWEVLLRWGTANGAAALQMQPLTGSFETGKKPGLLCLNGLAENQPVVERFV